MTNIKLLDNTTITCKTVEIQNGILILETKTDKSAEELHRMFSNKSNLNIIELQTQSGSTLGSKYGFVCHAGITLLEDGCKRIELIQEKDPTEQHLTRAETQAMQASIDSNKAVAQVNEVDTKLAEVQANVDQAILELTMTMTPQEPVEQPVEDTNNGEPEEGGMNNV